MTTKLSSHWLARVVALSLCLSTFTLPAVATGMDNPFLNFAFQLSYFGLPVCLVLLAILLVLKRLKDNKLKAAVESGSAAAGTDVGNASVASADTASPEPAKEEKTS